MPRMLVAGAAPWDAFVAARPDKVRVVAERFSPFVPYRLKSTGQICRVLGFHTGKLSCEQRYCDAGDVDNPTCLRPAGHAGEHDPVGDVTVYVHAEHPELGELTAVRVFGIEPDDLELWPVTRAPPSDDLRAVIIGMDVIEDGN